MDVFKDHVTVKEDHVIVDGTKISYKALGNLV